MALGCIAVLLGFDKPEVGSSYSGLLVNWRGSSITHLDEWTTPTVQGMVDLGDHLYKVITSNRTYFVQLKHRLFDNAKLLLGVYDPKLGSSFFGYKLIWKGASKKKLKPFTSSIVQDVVYLGDQGYQVTTLNNTYYLLLSR